ncbi:UPF0103-domain-containing protein [Atractiella rhizophila]|nr:UPF0103-domain-containing protein [Atractiella rhizophila]
MATRRATHAGSWYSDSPSGLSSMLSGFLAATSASTITFPVPGTKAVIAPHAGYDYSGPTAAWAYAAFEVEKIKRIFILGPSHHVYIPGCALSACSSYATPIGDLPLDLPIISSLRSTGKFEDLSKRDDEAEHSLELHLPYLVHIFKIHDLPPPPIVPIVVGAVSFEKEKEYGALLAPYLQEEGTVAVVSSDFCHWGRRFDYTRREEGTPIWQSIASLDRNGMNAIAFPNPQTAREAHEEFKAYLKETKNTICGRHPIGVLLAALASIQEEQQEDGWEIRWTRYDQSSKCTRSGDSSVSYGSGVVTKR